MDRPEVRRCLDRLPAKVRRGLLAGRWPSRALRSVVSMEALFIAANLLVVAVGAAAVAYLAWRLL